ncbi:hypothetical protein GGR52DRAFT_508084 [Hypoxylon sp. FL1284]|nr:hypothetical protein GGR52DRAFT_508084 [Hypoxylon sp. FL1284]
MRWRRLQRHLPHTSSCLDRSMIYTATITLRIQAPRQAFPSRVWVIVLLAIHSHRFSDSGESCCMTTITASMVFLLSAAEVYATHSDLWIKHDQLTVARQEIDLHLPEEIISRYRSIMALPVTATTERSTTVLPPLVAARVTSTIAATTLTTDSPDVFASASDWKPRATRISESRNGGGDEDEGTRGQRKRTRRIEA